MGHVINLAAVASLKAMGHQEKDNFLGNDKAGCDNDVEKDGKERKTMILKNPIMTILIHSQYRTG